MPGQFEAMMMGFDLLEAALFPEDGQPTSEEIDEMEASYAAERAVRAAQDEQQAYRDTPGGVD
jgi:hypothetical protein